MIEETAMISKIINTTQFGEIEVDEEHIFIFDEGVLGFEDLREFVLIAEEETIPFKWLISVESPEIGFPLLSPWHIDLTYNPTNDFDIEKLNTLYETYYDYGSSDVDGTLKGLEKFIRGLNFFRIFTFI